MSSSSSNPSKSSRRTIRRMRTPPSLRMPSRKTTTDLDLGNRSSRFSRPPFTPDAEIDCASSILLCAEDNSSILDFDDVDDDDDDENEELGPDEEVICEQRFNLYGDRLVGFALQVQFEERSARSLSKSPVPTAGTWIAHSRDSSRTLPTFTHDQHSSIEPLLDSSVRHGSGGNEIGSILSWAMAAIYIGGRLPQICLNIRRGNMEDIVLIRDPKDNRKFYPRFNLEDTLGFRDLDENSLQLICSHLRNLVHGGRNSVGLISLRKAANAELLPPLLAQAISSSGS